MRKLAALSVLVSSIVAAHVTLADPSGSPVTIDVVGHGEILVLVADGSTKPCDSSDNHVLFRDWVKAGEQVKVTAATDTICLDHTYGEFRGSEWAGPSILAPGRRSISTDAP